MSSQSISNRPTLAACTNSSIACASDRSTPPPYWMGLTRKRSWSSAVRMKRSSSGRTFGAQLLADPSAPRRWLRRLSLTGDGTLISCTLHDGLTALSVLGRTPRGRHDRLVRVDGPQDLDDQEAKSRSAK